MGGSVAAAAHTPKARAARSSASGWLSTCEERFEAAEQPLGLPFGLIGFSAGAKTGVASRTARGLFSLAL
jgi:hypothetical protein